MISHQMVALVGTDEIFQGPGRRHAIRAEVGAGFEVGVFATIESSRRWLADRFPDIPAEFIAPDRD